MGGIIEPKMKSKILRSLYGNLSW